ncbi:MAG: nucleoside-diphosphate sugar epimerase/dehydratase [Lachnospiraceae bacterium]|nr:nucleoside-diphosphate sugar epimerase/dehydratase [Lachnospiraceae bacterium]
MKKRPKIRKALLLYDFLAYVLVIIMVLFIHRGNQFLNTPEEKLMQAALGAVCIFGCRITLGVYNQVWRYGGTASYLKLIVADMLGFLLFYIIGQIVPVFTPTGVIYPFAITTFTCLICLTMRLLYIYIYKWSSLPNKRGRILKGLLKNLAAVDVSEDEEDTEEKLRHKIGLAIVGAGRVGTGLADDLMNSARAVYKPVCFIEKDKSKIGRYFLDIPVLDENDADKNALDAFGVQEIVFAIPGVGIEKKQEIIEKYRKLGYKLKIYDYPDMQSATVSRLQLREFEIEDVLFRKPVELKDKATRDYYAGKTVMVTGGGGSIGSEICRQLAGMDVRRIVVLDVAENGAYEVQQEIRLRHGDSKDVRVEIVSICDRDGLEQVFAKYKPDVVIHAAAHKHVPLMETNVVEAIRNNIFGTLKLTEMAEKYGTERFLMVSTDKAVNPTNVMGATKRMCEMIVQSRAGNSKVIYSATRFGNVLGSAGSVVPLFKKQIAKGGPVTVTDKRIVRYFMTIPEACQLVLKSGPMAKNGELFVLDMGEPVRIIDLAENMIRLSGFEPYKDIQIIETGLRPGEKLYEELLIKGENQDKTEDERIYVERDTALSDGELRERLNKLKAAYKTYDNDEARKVLKETVPTYRTGE